MFLEILSYFLCLIYIFYYYLYSLISSIYNVLLVIWEKQGDTTSIICPYYTSFEDLIGSMELNGKILMLSKMFHKDKYYYEPIELKLKGIDGEKLIPLNTYWSSL